MVPNLVARYSWSIVIAPGNPGGICIKALR